MRREMDPQSGTTRYSSLFPYWKLGSRIQGKQTLIFEIAVFVEDRNVIHRQGWPEIHLGSQIYRPSIFLMRKIQLNSAANLRMKAIQASICAISMYSSA